MAEPEKDDNGFLTTNAKMIMKKTHIKPYPTPTPSSTHIVATPSPIPIPSSISEEPSTKPKTDADIIQSFLDSIPAQGLTPQSKALLEQLINLIMQMGSSQQFLSQGKIDMRILSVLNEQEQVALGHFHYRATRDQIRYYGDLVDWILVTSPSINGLARRQVIQLVAAHSGRGFPEIVQRPGFIARHTYKRGWEKEAEEKGAIVVE